MGEFPAAAAAAAAALDSLHSAAQCAICYSLFDTPLVLKGCGHSCELLAAERGAWRCAGGAAGLTLLAGPSITAAAALPAHLPAVCSGCIRQNLEFQERAGPPACPTCR